MPIQSHCGAPYPLAVFALALGAGAAFTPDTSFARTPDLKAIPTLLATDCGQLQSKLKGLANTRIEKTERVAAGQEKIGGQPIGEHCLLTGAMFERKGPIDGLDYAIGFEMRLPANWNGRFWYQANGGIDGNVRTALGALGGGPITSALSQGFAVISSDAGHSNRITRGPGFGIDPQARLDYGYQAVGKLTPMAKQVIEAAYGRGPDTSYIGGCSNGGRHALVAASRYADQYDGYLIGAPGYRLPLAAVANIYGAQQYAKVATDPADLSSAFTDAQRKLVADMVLEQCDGLDGLADGMVQEIQACQSRFSLADHVPTCADSRKDTCLTSEQKQAIGAVFAGASTEDGQRFYASFPYDAGIAGGGVKQWEFSAPLKRDSGAVGLIWAVPPADPKTFNPVPFVLETPVDQLLASVSASNERYTESAMEFMLPVDPHLLHAVRERGAKIIAYHGNSDAIFSVNDTAAWIDALDKTHDGKASEFAKLFKVPGMDHCRGGPSADQFDMITPLVDWVENNQAPETIVAAVRGPGNPGGANDEVPADWSANRTRPLCPYPMSAQYDGQGDPEVATSFSCR